MAPEQKGAFKRAVRKFVRDLPSGAFRKGLRVKGIQGAEGIFEMTWADDGRATAANLMSRSSTARRAPA
jgi:hypothetical protein